MSMPAFYLPPAAWGADCILTGEELRHAHVLRMRPGEEAMLLDGQGQSAVCRILQIDKKVAKLEILRSWQTPRPEALAIVALALSKAVRRGFFLEKAAELGAAAVWLWQGRRSQGRLSPKLEESCQAQLIAGAKQCHNPWFPGLRCLKDAESVAKASSEAQWRFLPWEEQAANDMLTVSELGLPGLSLFVIGPEGGFEPAEVEAFKYAGFVTVGLGQRILRCETAATLCLGLHWWASQLPGKPNQFMGRQ